MAEKIDIKYPKPKLESIAEVPDIPPIDIKYPEVKLEPIAVDIDSGENQLTEINAVPFQGGAITHGERSQISLGGYSMVQNMRSTYPGLKKRTGIAKHNTTTDAGNAVSLYQFCKGKRTERHFYAQMSDGDILRSSSDPPTATGGVLGPEAWSGTTSPKPAAWSNIEEFCLHSNSVDQHQICAGTANYVRKFIKFDGSAAPPNVPTDGFDYTQQVTDGLTTTYAILDSLNTYANHECIFICTHIPASKLTWTFNKANQNDSVGTLSYRKNDNTWADTSESDGTEYLVLDVAPGTAWSVGATITGGTSEETCVIVAKIADLTYQISDRSGAFTLGEILTDGTYAADQGAAHPAIAALARDGSMTWSQPTDEIPCYMYGINAFWYRWETDTQLDAEVEVSSLTYGTDGTAAKHFETIVNVWDGLPVYAIEARLQVDTGEAYELFGTDAVEIDSLTTDGKVYFNSSDPIMGIYIDPGETPNTTASTTIDAVYTWTGAAFETLGTITDDTAGMSKGGWVTWARNTSVQPSQFDTSRYYSYWYYFEVDTALSDNVIISIETMPYFDINDAGRIGYANAAWKGRAVYNFNDQYGYVSAKNKPLVLNGYDFGIIEAGDGRTNKWTCALPFHNELMVWQEEKGKEGGCTTLFEGNSPTVYGKLIISTKLGCMNAQSAVVIDGVLTSTRTDEVLKTLAFWISRYGLCVSDGRTCSIFSDDIANYFDPLETTTCIRKGYEHVHFMSYDSVHNGLHIGLCTGTSATVVNKHFFFDLTNKCFYVDSYGQELSCMTEVEAASGAIAMLQYAGGTDDKAVYRINTGTDDIDIGATTTAIDGYVTVELNRYALWLQLREILIRVKVQAAGNVTITPYGNTIASSAITLSMTAETSGDAIRRHRTGVNVQNQNISLKIQNNTAGQGLVLLDYGIELHEKEAH